MPLPKTDIEYGTHAFNFISGCLHECGYCYAHGIARRFCREGWKEAEDGGTHELYSPIYHLNEKSGKFEIDPYPYGFDPTLHGYKFDALAGHKKPARVCVGFMGDTWGNWVPDDWIEDLMLACRIAPQHTYLFLTKDIHGYCDRFDSGLVVTQPNMWFGQTWDGEHTCLTDLREYG